MMLFLSTIPPNYPHSFQTSPVAGGNHSDRPFTHKLLQTSPSAFIYLSYFYFYSEKLESGYLARLNGTLFCLNQWRGIGLPVVR